MLTRLSLVVPLSAMAVGCGAPRTATNQTIDLRHHFRDADEACFVLLDVNRGIVQRFDPQRCRRRLPPCSTFKIPNALIGLETGAIPDADHVIAWDGKMRDREELNRDHTLRTAVKYSVVWYYQELARRVGERRLQELVSRIPYGNCDISAGLTEFWLGTSLAISADEQVEFLRRLHASDLPFSQRSMEIVRDIMVLDRGPDWVLRGKTGSHRGPPDLGWFVGYLETGHNVLIFAANIEGRGAFGPQARTITEGVLRELGTMP